MSKSEKNLSQIISEAQINILDSNESITEDRVEESSSFMKDALLAKCRDTIENLYTEIESQKRQRREAELTARESQSTLTNLERRLKESNSRVVALQEENESLNDQVESLKKSLKLSEKSSIALKIRDDMQDEITSFKVQINEKNLHIQELQNIIKNLESKLLRLDNEHLKSKEDLDDLQMKFEDLTFKCERLSAQSRISETVTNNLKQAQEDYQRYVKEEKENYEVKEKEMKEKYELLESKLKKRFQIKESQLKQEVKESIEDIQRSLEINDGEHVKTRSENLQLKETIKGLNEKNLEIEHFFREQIDKLEHEIQNAHSEIREKNSSIEKSESLQRIEKNKLDSAFAREKELESQVKLLEEKIKILESKNFDLRKNAENLNSEISLLKGEVSKETNKVQIKELEIKQLADKEKELNLKLNKLKEEKLEEQNKHNKDLEDKLESTANLIKTQILREYESKIEDYKSRISELIAENKMIKLKEPKDKTDESHEEMNSIKSRLSKMTSQKNAAEQKLAAVKEELSVLEDKIKQDSVFFRTEAMRKDEELGKLKKKFETKLREIYAENSIVTEQLRTDLLRLHSEVRNRDLKDSSFWLSKSLEDLMKKIPSY